MLTVDGSDERFIRICATGLLHAPEYRRFEPQFAGEMQQWTRPVPLLLDLRHFRGWTLAGFARDVAWDLRNRKTFSKIAVIGDACWHEWSTCAGMLLFRAKLRFFHSEQEARQWLGVADRNSES